MKINVKMDVVETTTVPSEISVAKTDNVKRDAVTTTVVASALCVTKANVNSMPPSVHAPSPSASVRVATADQLPWLSHSIVLCAVAQTHPKPSMHF